MNKGLFALLCVFLVLSQNTVNANLDLGTLSIVDEMDELVQDKPEAVAGAIAAAAGAHSVARSETHKEVKAEAMEKVADVIANLPGGGIAKDVAVADGKIANAIDQVKKDTQKSRRGEGLNAEKRAEEAVAVIAGGIKTEATAAVVEKLASDISTKNTPTKVSSVISAEGAANAVTAPGKTGKDNEKKIIDAASAVNTLSTQLKEGSTSSIDASTFIAHNQAEVVVGAPIGDGKAVAKAIESIDAAVQKAASEKQSDVVLALQKATVSISNAGGFAKSEAAAAQGVAAGIAAAGGEAPRAASGILKDATIAAATAAKVGAPAAAAVAGAIADTSNQDLKADASVIARNGNPKVGAAVAAAEIAVAAAVQSADSSDKKVVTEILTDVGASIVEAQGNKAKETGVVNALGAIGRKAKLGRSGTGMRAEAQLDGARLDAPALNGVADNLRKVEQGKTRGIVADLAVAVARDARLAGKNGDLVGQAVSNIATDLKKAGDAGGVIAADLAATGVKLAAANDLKAVQEGPNKFAEEVASAAAKAATSIEKNPQTAGAVANIEKRVAGAIVIDASSPLRVGAVASQVEKALEPLRSIVTNEGVVNAAHAGAQLVKVATSRSPSQTLKTATVAANAAGAIANSENTANVRSTAIGIAESARIIGAAAQTGDLAKTTSKINEVAGALSAAKKVTEATVSSEKAGNGKPDLDILKSPSAIWITQGPEAVKTAATAIADAAGGAEALTAKRISDTAAFVASGTPDEVNSKNKEVRHVATALGQSADGSTHGAAETVLTMAEKIVDNPASAPKIAKKEDKIAERRDSSSSSSSSSSSFAPFSPFPGFGGLPAPTYGAPFIHPAFAAPFVHPAFGAPFVHPAFAAPFGAPFGHPAAPFGFAPHPAFFYPPQPQYHPVTGPFTGLPQPYPGF